MAAWRSSTPASHEKPSATNVHPVLLARWLIRGQVGYVHRMVRYEDLLDAVRERLPGLDADRTREAIRRTVGGLLPWLPSAERAALAGALPAALRPGGPDDIPRARGDARRFVRHTAARERRPAEQVRYEAQAELSALAERDPELGRRLRAALPEDFGELLTAPGGCPPPDLSAGAGMPPAELTDDDVRELLHRLPEWSGDRRRHSRTVGPPDYLAQQLIDRIHGVEQQLGHHAVIKEQPNGGFQIEVWTHSEGLVTDLDAALAEAIDDVIDDVLGQPRPTAPPPPEREIRSEAPARGTGAGDE